MSLKKSSLPDMTCWVDQKPHRLPDMTCWVDQKHHRLPDMTCHVQKCDTESPRASKETGVPVEEPLEDMVCDLFSRENL